MSSVATSTAAVIVARDTAILEPLFATLCADPAICPKRVAAAAQLMWDVERLATGLWLVPASDGKHGYQVDATAKVCSCPDHQQRGVWCKHAIGVWLYQRWERAEAEAGQPADADDEIPYVLTAQAIAVLEPTRECSACDDQAQDHDGPDGQCTRHGVDAEGWWSCDCRGFVMDDAAA
jgi:SWIM zinc finger